MAGKDKKPERTSFAYQHRGELPGRVGDFYDDAGNPKQSFGTAHDAQIEIPHQSHQSDEAGGTAWAHIPRKERLKYADPHPPYALPAQKAPDENALKTGKRSDRQRSRDEFQAQRKARMKNRSKHRSMGR